MEEKKSTNLSLEKIHFIFAFDINKTLVMEDKAGGKTQHDCLNGILSDITYGVVKKNNQLEEWQWDGNPPSIEKVN